mgnify:CR=1 FL=1
MRGEVLLIFALCHMSTSRQYLLFVDPLERFSVVSFVWSPGQSTPIHDHGTWGVIGQLEGSECEKHYRWKIHEASDGVCEFVQDGDAVSCHEGSVTPVDIDDVHLVTNEGDTVAISIHAYGRYGCCRSEPIIVLCFLETRRRHDKDEVVYVEVIRSSFACSILTPNEILSPSTTAILAPRRDTFTRIELEERHHSSRDILLVQTLSFSHCL